MVEADKSGFRVWMLVPVAGALALLGLFFFGLERDRPNDLPSQLVGRTVPDFTLEALYEDQPGLSSEDLRGGGVKLLNIWASWCVPCRAEHVVLTQIAESGIPIYSINYKDTQADAQAFLAELGNPFTRIGADRRGRVFIEWGAFGVPETFVIDNAGNVVYRHIGPISPGDVEKYIMPAVERARAGGGA